MSRPIGIAQNLYLLGEKIHHMKQTMPRGGIERKLHLSRGEYWEAVEYFRRKSVDYK